MDRISTFNISADMAALQTALTRAELPAQLREPLQAIVGKITAIAAERPVSVYVTSSDETAPLRNHFAYLLVRALAPQIPSTLVVDCDFVNVGLSGLVPEKDALGFLDLLLYGSSLGVITQETQGGVKTIGAGSFPVTKRMPFALGAFEEAAHRLLHHARCVVFVGPLDEDEGGLHPLCGAVDLPVLVRELDAVRAGAVDPIEEQIASEWDSELLSVRLVASALPSGQMFTELLGDDEYEHEAAPPRAAAPVPVDAPPVPRPEPPPPSPPPPSPTLADLADPMPADEAAPRRPTRVAPSRPPGPPPRPRRGRGRAVVVAVFVIAIAVVAAKWFLDDRGQGPSGASSSERGQTAKGPVGTLDAVPVTLPADTARSVRGAGGSVAAGDSALAPDLPGTQPQARRGDDVRRADLTNTGGRSGGTVLINPEDIHVIEEIQNNWPDQFFIHISSFRKSVEARSEVEFLESNEFPVFIVFLDLGAKGKWYRVYAGPFKTREAARDVKKSLDDIPSVRFTRITKIEE